MKCLVILLFIILSSGCASSTNPNYYGYKDLVNKFEGSIIIEPKEIISFDKKTNINIYYNIKGEDLGDIKFNENVNVIKKTDRYILTSKSDAIDYKCEYSINNGEILHKKISRIEPRKFNVSSLSDELEDIKDFIDSDIEDFIEETICYSSQNMFRKTTYIYGNEVKNSLASNISKYDFSILKSIESDLDINSFNFKTDSKTLGIANYNGMNVLVNGSHIGFKISINTDNQNMNINFLIKGFSLTNIQTGLIRSNQHKVSFSANNTDIMTITFDTKIENVLLN